jgi:hypothetical protein
MIFDKANSPDARHASYAWWEVWTQAITSPTEETYQDLLSDPNATPGRAYLWLFITGTFAAFATAVMLAIFGLPSVPGAEDANAIMGYILIGMIVLSPLFGIMNVLGVMIFTALIQVVARMLIGEGTYSEMIYMFSAIFAPITLINSLISLIPFVNLLGIIISFYVIYLSLLAIKTVNRFGWGSACGSYLAYGALIIVLGCCITIGFSVLFSSMIPIQ